jgi:hypothetical protein
LVKYASTITQTPTSPTDVNGSKQPLP